MFQSQGKPSRPDHLKFSYLKLDPGKVTKGWISGPSISIDTHFAAGTKPCLNMLTEGKILCKFCIAELRKSFTVFQPFYSDLGEKMVALLGENSKELCDALSYGEQIIISKGKHKNSSYRLRQETFTSFACAYLIRLENQHDIRPWLLQLWGMPELVQLFGLEPELIPTKKQDKKEKQSKKIPVLTVKQALAKAKERMCSPIEDIVPPPKANGKH